MPDARPNILMIMTDQQRGDCLGCDGHPALETPYLDDLASKGTRFLSAYTACPSCIPARASLITGMDQWHTGILGMGRGQGVMHSKWKHTLPGELAKAGYHTQAIGKNHFNPQRALYGYHNAIIDESGRMDTSDYRIWFDRHKQGAYGYRDHSVDWNSWMSRPSHLPEHLHPTHWTAQQAIDWLGRRDPEKPFFLKVSFARPHSPYDPPQSYFDQYINHPRVPRASIGEWAATHDQPRDAADVNAWRGKRSDGEIHRARAAYYGSITFIDHQIGRILYELRRTQGQALANTMIVFFSDHGDMLGDHHLWRKTYAYEGSARIPMIVKLPDTWDAERGQVLDHVTEIRDIMPTLLDAADVDIPDTCDGQSMVPLVRGDDIEWREYLHGEHCWCYHKEQAMHYLTDGQEKFIYFPYLGTEQLFELTEDPGETNNLADRLESRTRVEHWRNILIDILAKRATGEVRDGKLVALGDDDVPVSPHYRTYGCAAN